MIVKAILENAANCKTQDDAKNLLAALQSVFGNASQLTHLSQNNNEAYMEGNTPFIHLELNRVISEYYITMICLEIRDDNMSINVVTNRMLDGHGISSQSWEVEEGMDDTIEVNDDHTIDDLAQRVKEIAIAHHAQLIERVGVAHTLALETAEKSW